MTRDDSKLGYLSSWDIDQLIAQDSVAVSAGDNVVYADLNVSNPNVYEVQFIPTGSSFVYQTGSSSTSATLADLFTFFAYAQGQNLHVDVPTDGTVRYFIWADKIVY